MKLELSNKNKKKLINYILLEKKDYSLLQENQLLQFYNPNTEILCSGRFIEFQTDNYMKVYNYFKEIRIYTLSNYIIYYKPKKDRLFMENLLKNDIIINKII